MQSFEERIRQYSPFFGDWEFREPPELLGRGNSGTVYRIWDRASGGMLDAAMKVIPIPRDERQMEAWLKESGGTEAGLRRRIQQEYEYVMAEIQTMETLKSDSHIVCFERYEIHQRKDVPLGWDVLIRMERLVPLADFLNNIGRYPHRQGIQLVLTIWDELLSGLCLCERYHVLHLDIKPDNIFYAEPSKDYFKLGDFGVSIRNEKNKIAGKGTRVGTVDYMAPEMYHFQGSDSRSDMYSLGVVVYELLNGGRLPFMSPTSKNTLEERYQASLTRLKEGKPVPSIKGVDSKLMRIILKSMAYRPEDRYADMQQMQAALRSYMYGTVEEVQPEKAGGKKTPLFIGLGIAGLLGAMVFMLPRLFDNTPEIEPTPTEIVAPISEETVPPTPTPTPTLEQTAPPTPTPTPTLEQTAPPTPTPTPTLEQTAPPTPTPTPKETPVPTPSPVPTLALEYDHDLELTEDQPYLVLESNLAIQVSLYYFEQNEPIELSQSHKADEMTINGHTEWKVSDRVSLKEGDVCVLAWNDDDGELKQEIIVVGASERAQVEMTLSELNEVDDQEFPVLRGNTLTVHVDAEPEQEVELSWWPVGEETEGESQTEPVSEDGTVEFELSSDRCGIDERGTAIQLEVRYADGLGAGRSAAAVIMWTTDMDMQAPQAEPVMEGDHYIHIATEPGARVSVYRDGELLGEAQYADDQGNCPWTGEDAFEARDSLEVRVRDQFGNEAYLDIPVGRYGVSVDNLQDGALLDSAAVVSGVARPGALLNIQLAYDGVEPHTIAEAIQANPIDGNFSVEVNAAESLSDVMDEAPGCYFMVGNDEDGFRQTEAFTWQMKALLRLEGSLNENSAALEFTAESGAQVRITRLSDGVTVYDEASPFDGFISYAPEDGFVNGESYRIEVIDAEHEERSSVLDVKVSEVDRVRIDAAVDNAAQIEGQAYPVVKGTELIVTGTAQANEEIEVVWQGEPNIAGSAVADPTGGFTVTLNAGDTIADDGSVGTLVARYADGKAGSMACPIGDTLWTTDVRAELSVDPLMMYSSGITVHTEAGATVSILRDGVEVGSGSAEPDGTYYWPADAALNVGDAYTVVCVDAFGNTAAPQTVNVLEFNVEIDGVENGVVRKSGIAIYGGAQPLTTLTVKARVDGEDLLLTEDLLTDENGGFAGIYNAWEGVDGKTVQIVITDSDGQEALSQPFTWNVSVPLALEPLTEESEALVIHTESGAMLRVTQTAGAEDVALVSTSGVSATLPGDSFDGETLIYEGPAGENGDYTIPPTEGIFRSGETYHIEASDPEDEMRPASSADVAVEAAVRAQISGQIQDMNSLNDQAAPVVKGGTMTIAGQAQSGELLEVIWYGNGEIAGTGTANEDGFYSISLDGQGKIGMHGQTGFLYVCYADGRARGCGLLTDNVLWTEDTDIDRLETSALTEGDTAITVRTEPLAWVSVSRDGSRVNPEGAQADEKGAYEFAFDAPVQVGEVYTIEASDAFDNRQSVDVPVAVDDFAPIELSLEPSDWINASTQALTVRGTAQPNEGLILSVNGQAYTVDVTPEGDFEWSKGIDGFSEISIDGRVVVSAAYASGHVNRASGEASVSVDRSVPTLEDVNLENLSSRSTEISGITENGATVTLSVDGQTQSTIGGPDGSFEFTGVELKDNAVVALWAQDAAGNVSQRLESTIGKQEAARIVVNVSEDGRTLRVGGWVVCDNAISLKLELGDKQPSVGEVVEADELRAEIAEYAQSEGVAVNVEGKTCIRIDKDIDISDLPNGTQTVRLVVDEFGEDPRELASATFEKQATGISRVVDNTPVLNEAKTFAFGLDDRPEMSSDGILLTGWYYGANNGDYTVSEVRVLVDYADNDTKAVDEIIESTQEMSPQLSLEGGLQQGYAKFTRLDVASVCPVQIQKALENVNPSEINAGFMVWIDKWNLPDGDYKVVVVLQKGEKHYPSAQLSIRNGEAHITAQQLAEIAETWNPQPVEESTEETGDAMN